METVQKLKAQAYKIATETCFDGASYRYSVDVRLDAMRTYAQLIMAENSNNTNTNMED